MAEFRSPAVAAETNTNLCEYLTAKLTNVEAGITQFKELLAELGNTVTMYPEWHPILTTPTGSGNEMVTSPSELPVYKGLEHSVFFVRGFVTCPYSEDAANRLVSAVNEVNGLYAYRLEIPLYSDHAYPVVVRALSIELEADGTIRSRDALTWFVQKIVKHAEDAQVAETWWNMRAYILGQPHGSRSSLFVNQHTGGHMRKILETLNNSGLYGEIKESSLDMFSEKKKKKISETLIRAALNVWDKKSAKFDFELRGETCKAEISDTWKDGHELSIRVKIGGSDLYTSGFYYADKDLLQTGEPNGKKSLAEKFL